ISFTLKRAGSQTITATDTIDHGFTGSISLAVGPGPTTHFQFTAPANVTAGTAFTVNVTALDAFENINTTHANNVRITSTGAPGILLSAPLSNGAGTFSITLQTAGSKTITVADPV